MKTDPSGTDCQSVKNPYGIIPIVPVRERAAMGDDKAQLGIEPVPQLRVYREREALVLLDHHTRIGRAVEVKTRRIGRVCLFVWHRMRRRQAGRHQEAGQNFCPIQAELRGGADGEDMALESMIEDEYAEERTEAAAADYLAEQTCAALMDEYVRHLRSVGIAQLKRKTAAARPLATRRERSSALPVYVQSRAATIDPEELRRLDERIARDCDIVRRHLFGQGEAASEEAELGLTRERIRQITRRAARLMTELAASNNRFAPDSDVSLPTLLPRTSQERSGADLVHVTEPEIESLDAFPLAALALSGAARH